MLVLNRRPGKKVVIDSGPTMVDVTGSRFGGDLCLEDGDGLKQPTSLSEGCLKVLLVEADLGNAEFMTVILEADGHQVQIARDGHTAFQLAQAEPPDVVLVEIRLPGLDGWEVVRRLQEQVTDKRPFCIAITGCGTEADRRRSQQAGIDIHMLKPVDSRLLRTILKRFQGVIGLDEGIPETSTARSPSRC